MLEPEGFILGFDPGGANNFGWSVCKTDGVTLSLASKPGCADNAQKAFDAVQEKTIELSYEGPEKLRVLAAGIDAPMLWGQGGNRAVDKAIRKELRKRPLSAEEESPRVLAVNSLWGSVLVQGILLAKYLYDAHKLNITETHPKALLQLLRETDDGKELDDLIEGLGNEHERDATVSAFAAWKMQMKADGWKDIYKPYTDLGDPPFGVPSGYWMPTR